MDDGMGVDSRRRRGKEGWTAWQRTGTADGAGRKGRSRALGE